MFKRLLICFAAGLTALGVGLGIFYVGEFVGSIFQTKEKVEIVETAAVEPETIPVEELTYPKLATYEQEPAETEGEENNEFDPDGTYYIIGEQPKGLNDVISFYVTTVDYSKALETAKSDYDDFRIPPKGSVEAAKELNFTRIAINGRMIAFETETNNGVSYEFTGEFMGEKKEEFKVEYKVEDGETYTTYADLKGTLIKKRNGKKVAESDVKLQMGGC